MAYRVDVTEKALADIEEAYLYLSEVAPEYAVEWYRGLFEAIDTLEEFPNRCALAPEGKRFRIAVRQLLYGRGMYRYRILFMVEEERVVALRVRHSARKSLKKSDL